uniref:Pyrimidine-specific ribonucleoside hydrolase RihA (Trinotate prediction) n=1 Tax=Henneguya salminicola TaxID=69463 RepID=A0A6G3MHU9_HENSL
MITLNANKILSFLKNGHIPVYGMGSYNLGGKHIESDGYFGENAFANIELPATTKNSETDMFSPTAMIHYVRKYPKQVHFICIGPLTNIALAFLLDNEFPSLVGSISIMGSDSSSTTFMNVTPYAEFNAHVDPWAFKIVGEHFTTLQTPIILFDWYLCWNNLLPFEMINKVQEYGCLKQNTHLELMAIITDSRNEILRKNFWKTGFLTADLFAGVGFHTPSIITGRKRVSLENIEISGEKFGHTIYKDDTSGVFELITSVDVPKMAELVLKVLLDA